MIGNIHLEPVGDARTKAATGRPLSKTCRRSHSNAEEKVSARGVSAPVVVHSDMYLYCVAALWVGDQGLARVPLTHAVMSWQCAFEIKN